MTDKEKARRLKYLVSDPATITTNSIEYAAQLGESPGLKTYTILDLFIPPLRQAVIWYILARPSMGKTSFTLAMAKSIATAIKQNPENFPENAVVVYVTVEQTVEDASIVMMGNKKYSSSDIFEGRVPIDDLRAMSAQQGVLPVFFIGNSRHHFGKRQPVLNIEGVIDIIYEIMSPKFGSKVPVIIFVDYLQYLFPSDANWRDSEVAMIQKVVIELDNFKKQMGIPLVVPVQAGRQVDTYDLPVPGSGDAYGSAHVEKYADEMGSLFRPIRKWPSIHKDPLIEIDGKNYDNRPQLFVYNVLKSRHSKGVGMHVFDFEPQTMTIGTKLHSDNMIPDDLLNTRPKGHRSTPSGIKLPGL